MGFIVNICGGMIHIFLFLIIARQLMNVLILLGDDPTVLSNYDCRWGK
ncbi:hypothetical protein [Clostridium algoriphilum]